MKVGRKIAIFVLVILFIILGGLLYIYYYGGNGEQPLERKLRKMAKSFYEDYYYNLVVEDKGSKEDAIVYLSGYADSGLKISYDNLKIYYNQKNNMNYTDLSVCNEEKTRVIIYPKSPYGNKDYEMEVELLCDLSKATEDSKKFKKKYEDLNGTEGLSEVKLDDNNLFEYSSLEEVNKMIKSNKTFVVVFGSPYLDESRYTVSSFVDISKENKIDKIYFIDIKKDNKDENDIRTLYSLEDGELKKTKEGSKEYIYFVNAAKDILPIPYENYINGTDYEGEKTIYNSAYIYVEKGVPISYTSGLPTDTQDYKLVDTNRIEEIFREFYNKRKSN